MPIRCKVEQVDGGIVLSRLLAASEAEHIRSYFAKMGVEAMLTETQFPGDHRVYLGRLSLEIFRKIASGANIELIG